MPDLRALSDESGDVLIQRVYGRHVEYPDAWAELKVRLAERDRLLAATEEWASALDALGNSPSYMREGKQQIRDRAAAADVALRSLLAEIKEGKS